MARSSSSSGSGSSMMKEKKAQSGKTVKPAPKSKRFGKGPCMAIFRWIFVLFCVVVLGFSIALLVMSTLSYIDMRAAFDELQTQKRFDVDSDKFMEKFRPEAALGIFYFGIVLGILLMLLTFFGFIGGFCLDRCYLILYGVLMGLVLVGSGIGFAVAWNIHYDDLNSSANKIYSEFVKHLYGRENALVSLFAMSVDQVQQKHRCCGIMDTVGVNDTYERYKALPAQYTIIFWIEATQWGQAKANAINFKPDKQMMFAPKSCCKIETDDCSMGSYTDHFQWSQKKEDEWTGKLNIDGCGKYLLDFGHLESGARTRFIVAIVFCVLFMVASVIFAFILGICGTRDDDD